MIYGDWASNTNDEMQGMGQLVVKCTTVHWLALPAQLIMSMMVTRRWPRCSICTYCNAHIERLSYHNLSV